MRILAATALLLATIATPAFAQTEETPFGGFHVEALAGWDHVDDGVDKEDGVSYGAAFGYDYQATATSVVLGVEGEAMLSTTDECAGTICAKAGRDLYGGVRVGVPVSNAVMVYGKAGYTNARLKGTNAGTTLFTQDLDGIRAGIGVQANFGAAFARAELRYSNYEQGFERQQALVGLGFRF